MTKQLISTLALACFTVSGQSHEVDQVAAGDPATASREVAYHEGDIVPLSIQKGYVAIVEIPETAVAVICGDCKAIDDKGSVGPDSPGHWVVQALPDTNKISISAWSPGARTNANVMGASGKLYPFSLREISRIAGEHADLLVRLRRDGSSSTAAPIQAVKYVPAATADSYKTQAEEADRKLKAQQAQAATAIAAEHEKARDQVQSTIRHDYVWNQNAKAKETFRVKAIYLLDGFLYIEATPQEAPALYEIREGKDSLVQFTYKDGVYIAPKEIDKGYLRIGKSKLDFHRESKNG